MLQHVLRGHGFILAQSFELDPMGCFDPGFWGPHTALAIGKGNGGVPSLRHSQLSGQNPYSQPFQPVILSR